MKIMRLTVAAIVLATIWGVPLPAQSGEPTPGMRPLIVRRGMTVLGSWAAANLIVGTTGALVSDDPQMAGFWEMNALWNTVNLGLAGGTLIAENRRMAAAGSPDSTGSAEFTLPVYREASHRLEKTLLFNAGLDIGYMTLGGWLWERGARGEGLPSAGIGAERLTGWGQALVVQGAFLFIFDVVLARRLAGDRRSLQ